MTLEPEQVDVGVMNMLEKKRFITVDPSIHHTGFALFDCGQLIDTRLCRVKGRNCWLTAAHGMSVELWNVLREWDTRSCQRVSGVWCEYPQHFGTSPVGNAAAVRGDVMKVAHVCGMFHARVMQWNATNGGVTRVDQMVFMPVPVLAWKGQLNKAIVNAQVLQILGRGQCMELKGDEWDAVGLGLYLLGRFPLQGKKGGRRG